MKAEQHSTKADIFLLHSIFSASLLLTQLKKKSHCHKCLSLPHCNRADTHHLEMFSNIAATTLRKGTLEINGLGIAFFSILRDAIHLLTHLQSAALYTALVSFSEAHDGDFQKHIVGGLPSFLLQSKG